MSNPHDVAKWITEGLLNVERSDSFEQAFPVLAGRRSRDDSFARCLLRYDGDLGADERPALRAGLELSVGAISNWSPAPHQFRMLLEAIEEFALWTAVPTLSDSLPLYLQGLFAGESPSNRVEQYRTAAAAARTLFKLCVPGDSMAGKAIGSILETKAIGPSAARYCLLALCKIDRRGLAGHLSLPTMRELIRADFSNLSIDNPSAVLADAIFAVLGTIAAAESIDALNTSWRYDPGSNEILNASTDDDWLLEAWFDSNSGRMEVQIGDLGNHRYVSRDDPEIWHSPHQKKRKSSDDSQDVHEKNQPSTGVAGIQNIFDVPDDLAAYQRSLQIAAQNVEKLASAA